MNELLKKIITIEEKAQQIVESGYDEQKEIRRCTEEDVSDLESNILHKQQTKVEQLRELEFEGVNEIVNGIMAKTEEKKKKLLDLAEQQKEAWADQLVNLVLSR